MPACLLQHTTVPVVVDDAKCIADKGCTVCVDVCPLDVLAHQRHDQARPTWPTTSAGTACRARRTARPARSRSTFPICCGDRHVRARLRSYDDLEDGRGAA